MSTESATTASHLPRNGVVRNISYLFGGQLTTWTLSVAWTFIVPRQIGPTGMGQLVTVLSGIGILTIVVSLGTKLLLVTEIARAPWSAGNLVAAATLARLVLFIPSAGLMALYLSFAHFSHYQVVLLTIATATLPLFLVSDAISSAFQGLERMQYLAYLDITYKAVTMVGGIILVLLGFRVLGLVLLGTLASALVLTISIFWANSHFDLTWRVRPTEIRRMIVKSLPFWATTMINTFYLWIDSILLALLASANEVGWYGVPTRLFGALLFIPVIISTATLARLTATFVDGRDSFTRTLTPIVETTMMISLPLAAGTIAVAVPAVRFLYGPAYSASGPVLIILALSIPPTYLNIVVNQSLVASNRQVVWTKVMAVGAAVNVLLNLIAIPTARDALHNAALGAAWSLLTTEVIMAATGLYLVRHSVNPRALRRIARAAVAALIMGVVAYAGAPLGLLVQIGVGIVVFVGLAVALRLLSPHELAEGRLYAARLWIRPAGSKAS